MSVEFDIHAVINKLSEVRHAFVSEGDFQFELMKAISLVYPKAIVTAEYCYPYECDEKAGNHTDIIVQIADKVIPIELKYKVKFPKNSERVFDNRKVYLPDSKGYNSNCHAFFLDISKTQRMIACCGKCEEGYCLFLTNESSYWNPAKLARQCREFLLCEGIRIATEYAYHDKNNRRVVGDLVTSKTRYKPITLLYPCSFHWEKYPSNDTFRLLICEVRQP